jgi:hypothetical protein
VFANIVADTVPVSPVDTIVPVAAGNVKLPDAIAEARTVVVPEVEPLNLIPVLPKTGNTESTAVVPVPVVLANIVVVTVPESPVVTTVPVVAGNVMVVVPAVAVGWRVTVPDVAPGKATLLMPVSARFVDVLFKATAVVPTYKEELPRTADGIVPDKLPAVRFVKLAPETAPNEADQVPLVIVPVVVKLVDPARGEAPNVLYEIVRAVEPLNVVPDAAPVPLLSKVALFVTLPELPVVLWLRVGTSAT